MSQTHTLVQDCTATIIPAGDVVTLPAGTEVFITQTLGGNVTVRTDRGLFRIARENATAIGGYTPGPLAEAAAAAAAAEFNEQAVWDALKSCFDPEIPVNIVDLGLVYDLAIETTPSGGHHVEVKMTLTAPGCGMGPVIAEDAREKIAALPTVESAKVHIVWDPQWSPQMISETGRKILGLE
jgi:probable FeS assembly SUF system protein SufT